MAPFKTDVSQATAAAFQPQAIDPPTVRLAGVRLHDLPHTFASRAAMNRETLRMIGRLLGRRGTISTSLYVDFDDDGSGLGCPDLHLTHRVDGFGKKLSSF